MINTCWKWFAELSGLKLFLLILSALVGIDMVLYYIGAFMGKPTEPYPILYEVFSLLKEIHIGGLE